MRNQKCCISTAMPGGLGVIMGSRSHWSRSLRGWRVLTQSEGAVGKLSLWYFFQTTFIGPRCTWGSNFWVRIPTSDYYIWLLKILLSDLTGVKQFIWSRPKPDLSEITLIMGELALAKMFTEIFWPIFGSTATFFFTELQYSQSYYTNNVQWSQCEFWKAPTFPSIAVHFSCKQA